MMLKDSIRHKGWAVVHTVWSAHQLPEYHLGTLEMQLSKSHSSLLEAGAL